MIQRIATPQERKMIVNCSGSNMHDEEGICDAYKYAAMFAVDKFGRNPETTTLFIVVCYGSHLEEVLLEGYIYNSETKKMKPFDGNNFHWQGK